MKIQSSHSSIVLDNLRVPLALGVICSHAYVGLAEGIKEKDISDILEVVSYFMLKFCSEFLPPLVVPGFFLLSGYFFFLKWKESNGEKVWDWMVWVDKLHKRLYTLLIPYLIWNIVPIVIGIIICIINSFIESTDLIDSIRLFLQGKGFRIFWTFYDMGTSDTMIWGVPFYVSTAPYNFPLYYVRDLMGICIVSPIIFYVIKKTKLLSIVILLALGTFGMVPSYPGLRSSAIIFFSIGAYFSINNKDLVKTLRGKVYPPVLILLIILFFMIYGKCPAPLRFLYVPIGLLSLLRLCDTMVKSGLCVTEKIIKSIFFFYVAHEGLYILQGIRVLVCSVFPAASYSCVLVQYIFIIGLTLGVCIAIRLIISRYMPTVAKFVGA